MLERDYPDEPPELPDAAWFDPADEDIQPETPTNLKGKNMPIIIKKGADFIPAPEGLWPAVCVDVIDLGMVDSRFGRKHKIRLVWEIDALMPPENKERFTVRGLYTASLHEKANLRKLLKIWRTRDFTPEELEGFDIEKIIGAPCQLLIAQTEKEGTIYANVTALLKAVKKLAPSGAYVRAKDRPDTNGQAPSEPEEYDSVPEEEMIPF